jgi:PIN domain nuclease of toxin-antitoxin system
MRLLLDTHILIWHLEQNPKRKQVHSELIEDTANDVIISMASLWEMSIKVGLGKLNVPLGMSFTQLEQHLKSLDFQILEMNSKHLDVLMPLPLHHRDPFDRMLIAQVIAENATLVSDDGFFGLYGVPLV